MDREYDLFEKDNLKQTNKKAKSAKFRKNLIHEIASFKMSKVTVGKSYFPIFQVKKIFLYWDKNILLVDICFNKK